MEKISYTLTLMRASYEVLKKDKELLVFPLLSALCCLVVFASFALPLWNADFLAPPSREAPTTQKVLYYGVLFAFYWSNYFVVTFFNAGVIACAVMRIRGQDPTLADGLRAAASRLSLIAGWALVAATVGLILRIIEDRSERVGRLVAGLLGMAWSMVTFLVVPILVVERKGPLAALKESTARLRRTWGEQLIGRFSFGLVFFLLGIPAVLLVVLGFVSGSPLLLAVLAGAAVLYVVLLALVQSTLSAIFQAAVYVYATEGRTGETFTEDLMAGALGAR